MAHLCTHSCLQLPTSMGNLIKGREGVAMFRQRGKWGPSQGVGPYAAFGGHSLDNDSPVQGERRRVAAGSEEDVVSSSSRVGGDHEPRKGGSAPKADIT